MERRAALHIQQGFLFVEQMLPVPQREEDGRLGQNDQSLSWGFPLFRLYFRSEKANLISSSFANPETLRLGEEKCRKPEQKNGVDELGIKPRTSRHCGAVYSELRGGGYDFGGCGCGAEDSWWS